MSEQGQERFLSTFIGKACAVSVGAAALVYAARGVGDIGIDWPFSSAHVPDFNISTDPPVAEAGVDNRFTEIEEEFDIRCRAQIGVAVGVHGFKNGPVGDGVVDKKIFGDFLPCSDSLVGSATLVPNEATGEVARVKIKYDDLEVTHPRVDFEDGRNCADIDANDSPAEATKAIAKREEKIAQGKKAKCDDGFDVTQFGGPDSLAEVKDFSFSAAQLAMYAVDPRSFENINAKNKEEVRQYYQDKYPTAIIEFVGDLPIDYSAYVEKKLEEHQNEVRAQQKQGSPVFKSVTIEVSDGKECKSVVPTAIPRDCKVIKAFGYDSGRATIKFAEISTVTDGLDAEPVVSSKPKPADSMQTTTTSATTTTISTPKKG